MLLHFAVVCAEDVPRFTPELMKADAAVLTVADTEDMAKVFPPDKPNGDGIVPASMVEDESLKAAIADIITALGADTDRSNEPGISADKINAFFEQAGALLAWQARLAADATLHPGISRLMVALVHLVQGKEAAGDTKSGQMRTSGMVFLTKSGS